MNDETKRKPLTSDESIAQGTTWASLGVLVILLLWVVLG